MLPVLLLMNANLGINESFTTPSGVHVTFVAQNHKHADDGETLGIWRFRFDKKELEVRGQLADAELVYAGNLYLVASTKVAARVRIEEKPLVKKLSEDDALERAKKSAKGIAYKASRMHEENGIYRITLYDGPKVLFHYDIGAYTRRVMRLEIAKDASTP